MKKAEEAGVFGDYAVPLPVRYVLEKGYGVAHGYPVVDVPYDPVFGAQVDEQYYDEPESAEPAAKRELYVVGNQYQEMALGVAEAAQLYFAGSALNLVVLYDAPTDKELENFKSGAIETKLAVVDGVMVILLKFGDSPWMEVPAYPRLPQELLSQLLPGYSYALQLQLFDSRNGMLMVSRSFGVKESFAACLKAEYDKLRSQGPSDPEAENKRAHEVMARYDTAAILAKAIERKTTTGS